MALYETLLTIHVLAAVTWVGANFGLSVLAARVKSADPARLPGTLQDFGWYGQRFNFGSSLVLIVTAVWMVLDQDAWKFSQAWIIIGLAIYATSFVIGAAFLGPTGDKIGKGIQASGGQVTPEVEANIDRLLTVARFELVVLMLAVVDMVVKPGMPS
jgi:uncharacterized membrane protein